MIAEILSIEPPIRDMMEEIKYAQEELSIWKSARKRLAAGKELDKMRDRIVKLSKAKCRLHA